MAVVFGLTHDMPDAVTVATTASIIMAASFAGLGMILSWLRLRVKNQ